jgi:hypothetical protein
MPMRGLWATSPGFQVSSENSVPLPSAFITPADGILPSFLLDRIPFRVHASRESALECIHLLVVGGLFLVGLVLHLCTR